MHFSSFENMLMYNNPEDHTLLYLKRVLTNPFPYQATATTVEEMRQWLADYATAPADGREHITKRCWDTPELLIDPDLKNVVDPADYSSWLIKQDAYTLDVIRGQLPLLPRGEDLCITLKALRRTNALSWVSGRAVRLWYWNPQGLPIPRGGPQKSVVPTTPDVSFVPLCRAEHKEKAQKLLAGFTDTTFESFCKVFVGHVPRGQKACQKLRELLTDCGWSYNRSFRMWEAPK